MQLIFGSAPAFPELPKDSPAEWPDKVTVGESLELVEEAVFLSLLRNQLFWLLPGGGPFSSASHASCPLSETCLLLKRRLIFWLSVLSCCGSHDYTAPSTGLYIQSLALGERVTMVACS